MAGTLFVVATPIGNLEDITLRALRILREVDLVLAEDTRRSKVLLRHHGIATPLRSFHAHSSAGERDAILRELADGRSMALVSDAGTPLVSDPGDDLVEAARGAGISVEAIPGPSAALAALSVAGFRVPSFRFVGFLPRGGGRRKRALEALRDDPSAVIFFEAPGRLEATLRDLEKTLGERPIAVCRELTKLHEEVRRGTAAELAAHFTEPLGEITLVVSAKNEPTIDLDDEDLEQAIDRELERLAASDLSHRDATEQAISSLGLARKVAYRRILELRQRASS